MISFAHRTVILPLRLPSKSSNRPTPGGGRLASILPCVVLSVLLHSLILLFTPLGSVVSFQRMQQPTIKGVLVKSVSVVENMSENGYQARSESLAGDDWGRINQDFQDYPYPASDLFSSVDLGKEIYYSSDQLSILPKPVTEISLEDLDSPESSGQFGLLLWVSGTGDVIRIKRVGDEYVEPDFLERVMNRFRVAKFQPAIRDASPAGSVVHIEVSY